MNKKILEIIYLGIFVILVGVFFQKVFRGKVPVPTDTLIGLYHPWLDQASETNPSGVPFKNFLITDPIRQQIPWRKLAIEKWKSGQIPVWNAYNFSGAPLNANVQAGIFYPLNIVFFLLPFIPAWTVLIILQPLLGGIFFYLYMRSKNIHAGAAVAGSIAWGFCGFSIAWLTWGTIVHVAIWLPLILLSIDALYKVKQKKHIAWWMLGLTFFISSVVFAGHMQIAMYMLLLALAYGALLAGKHKKRSLLILLSLGLAVIITSIQWRPLLEGLKQSSRLHETTGWLKEGWFVPWHHLVQFVAPDFFGNPATLNYWGAWNYGEFIGYIGILPLIMAIYALISSSRRLVRFFAGMATLALLFLLPTPIARLPFEWQIPFLSTLQPTRLMAVIDVCLVILAVFGLDLYVKRPTKRIFIAIALVGLAVAGLWVYVFQMQPTAVGNEKLLENLQVARRNLILPSILWGMSAFLLSIFFFVRRWEHVFFLLVIGVISFDVFRFGWKFTPFTTTAYFFPTTKAVSFLQSQPRPFRIMSLDNRIMPPNVNAYYGLESVEGYDPVYDGRYEEFMAALNRKEPNITPPFGFNRIITGSTIDSKLFPLLNVKYVLALEEIKNPDLELMYQEKSTRVYWYKKATPRLYLVEDTVLRTTKQEIIDMLHSPSFDAGTMAVVEREVGIINMPLSTAETVEILSYDPALIVAKTRFMGDRFVVIANMYNQNLHVEVDDVSTEVYRANYIFGGVVIPKGEHTLRVSYR
jgi:hypothetical protein